MMSQVYQSNSNPLAARDPKLQVIEGKYINARALMDLLQTVYGKSEKGENNFAVYLRLNRYKIYRPSCFDEINDRQIGACRKVPSYR